MFLSAYLVGSIYAGTARRHGWTEPELKAWLKDLWNYDTTQAIRREHFDGICEQLGQHVTDTPQ